MKRDDRYKTEDTVENYAVAQLKKIGGVAAPKPAEATRRGWFDRLFFLPGGVVLLVEFKRPVGGKFEPLQERTHRKFLDMGFDVRVWNTRDQVDAFVRVWMSGVRS